MFMRLTGSADGARTLLIDSGGLGMQLADFTAPADGSADASPDLSRLLRRARLSTLGVAGREAVTGLLLTGRHDAIRVWPPGPVGFLGGWAQQGWDQTERGRRSEVVIRADPVSLSPSADQLILTSARIPDLSAADADSLLAYLNDGLETHAASLHRREPYNWYLTLADAPTGRWWAPGELEGQHVLEFMPSGPGCRSLNRLITEVQMMLHEHPINLRRSDAGLPPLNSLWPWGWYADEQRPQPPVMLARPQIDDGSDADAYAAGLAILADQVEARFKEDSFSGAASSGATQGVSSGATEGATDRPTGDTTPQFALVSPAPGENAAQFRGRLERDWCSPWLRDLRQSRIRRVCIATVAGDCAVVNRLDLFRFWRRGPRIAATR